MPISLCRTAAATPAPCHTCCKGAEWVVISADVFDASSSLEFCSDVTCSDGMMSLNAFPCTMILTHPSHYPSHFSVPPTAHLQAACAQRIVGSPMMESDWAHRRQTNSNGNPNKQAWGNIALGIHRDVEHVKLESCASHFIGGQLSS